MLLQAALAQPPLAVFMLGKHESIIVLQGARLRKADGEALSRWRGASKSAHVSHKPRGAAQALQAATRRSAALRALTRQCGPMACR